MRTMKHVEHKLLSALCDAADLNEGHIKIHNGSYMPLVVEGIGEFRYRESDFAAYSLCHYGEMNGDLMRDPEVCVFRITKPHGDYFFPYLVRMDYSPVEAMRYQESITETGWRPRLQNDQATFLRQWLRNLRDQGFEDELKKQYPTEDILCHVL